MRIIALLRCALTFLAIVAAPAEAAPDPGVQVDAMMRRLMADRQIPGAQVAVVRDGRVVLLRHYGVANLQTPVPVTDGTIFSVNSITKAFTGIAAMREVEAGRLDLAKPVSAYLTGLPEAWRGVTVRQLLSHSSGLPDFASTAGQRQGEGEAAWAWALTQPVRFPAGARFDYSQTNYALVQNILNTVNGCPLDDPIVLAQTALVGMPATGLHDGRDVVPGKAAAYAIGHATPSGPAVPRGVFEVFAPKHRAASGLDSNASDMARWMNAILGGRLLGPALLRTMWTRTAFNDGSLGQWGMGWLVRDRAVHRAVGMTGGSRAAMFLYPDDHVGVVVLTNLAGAAPEDLVDEIAALYIPGMRLEGVAALRAALDREGYGNAPAILARLRADSGFRVDEQELNDWGYRLLSFGKPKEALAVMKIGVDLFPLSGNAYDSLADAYAINGDKARAIAGYERSLVLDPNNGNAVRRLKTLRE
jgi:CubicO group peptidase (beta-lactamase class C family)